MKKLENTKKMLFQFRRATVVRATAKSAKSCTVNSGYHLLTLARLHPKALTRCGTQVLDGTMWHLLCRAAFGRGVGKSGFWESRILPRFHRFHRNLVDFSRGQPTPQIPRNSQGFNSIFEEPANPQIPRNS